MRTTRASALSFVAPTLSLALLLLEPLAHAHAAADSNSLIVWHMDSTASLGGHSPEVLGAPKILAAAEGGPALEFDGLRDGLVLSVNPLANWSTFTIEVLFMPAANSPAAQRFVHIEDDRESRVTMETRSADGVSWSLDTYLQGANDNCTLRDLRKVHPCDTWTWVALVYDGKAMSSYVNGVKELEGEVAFAPMTTGRMSLGVRLNRVYWFKGCIKEVRFHPAVIAPARLQR